MDSNLGTLENSGQQTRSFQKIWTSNRGLPDGYTALRTCWNLWNSSCGASGQQTGSSRRAGQQLVLPKIFWAEATNFQDSKQEIFGEQDSCLACGNLLDPSPRLDCGEENRLEEVWMRINKKSKITFSFE
ncbi:hypothetical protein MA16_Dca014817 [Dendrobium catenatum]|uniref:Uncharacterized protein n=1 Tax=Dendrobium catenatum TaxID=906689 RepID=A0A2I0W6A4_9ASPA|nr:hypothetical protein MA16_Dca014817 [Dendrobium catenatum]